MTDKSYLPTVEGDLTKTAMQFAKKKPGLRINLLHLDVDAYAPTLADWQPSILAW